jgi:hypothetical protein
VKASIKNNTLILEIPLQAPRPSSTGKTLTVASTGGFTKTDAEVNGKTVSVSLNACIKP